VKSFKLKLFLSLLLISAATAHSQSIDERFPNSAPDSYAPSLETFGHIKQFHNLRFEMLNLIGGAAKRVWLVTDFLSDSDIVSALFVAQFRGLDTRVILGRKRARHPLSRLPFLQQQKIPTFIDMEGWPRPFKSALLTDHGLIFMENSLDPQLRNVKLPPPNKANRSERLSFVSYFKGITSTTKKPRYQPLPAVGRARGGRRRTSSRANPSTFSNNDVGNGYNYNRTRHNKKAPSGVPTRLPRRTVKQQRGHSD
jgi:hypothetical protein